LLIYKLFNFFIRLTKELHLCHVFAVSSDSLFKKYGFSNDEKELAWEYCGGKPVCLLELINAKERAEKLDELLQIRIGQMEGLIEDARKKRITKRTFVFSIIFKTQINAD